MYVGSITYKAIFIIRGEDIKCYQLNKGWVGSFYLLTSVVHRALRGDDIYLEKIKIY